MQPLGTNSLALCIVFIALIVCSAGQTVHGYLRTIQSSKRTRAVAAVYETAILVHLMIMAAFALGCVNDGPNAYIRFLYLAIPLHPVLWLNMAIALVAAYTSLSGIEDDELPLTIDAPRWAPAADAITVLLCMPPIASLLSDSWPIVLYFDAAYFLFRTIHLLILDKCLRHRMVSALSIAEAMKRLPEGLLYADRYGHTLVANDAMRHCLSSLGISTDFGRVDDLWDILNEHAAGDCAVPVAETVEREHGNWVLLRIGQNVVRLFSFEGMGFERNRNYPSTRPLGESASVLDDSRQLLGGEACMRVIAYDVTDEVEILQEIDRTNTELATSQRKLQESMGTVQEAAENEAMLRMRGRVHDVIGQRLSMLHRALEDEDLSDEKLAQLKPLLNSILDDLAADTQVKPADDLAATIDAFGLTGVNVKVEGKLPVDETRAQLFVDCIREGTTNAVKHAHATLVNVVCKPDLLVISNDGAAPENPVTEGTGLTNMRRAVESAGGTLAIEPSPFTLTIELP